MSSKEDLDVTELALADVSKEISKLSTESRLIFTNDQARIQTYLRVAVRTIQGVHATLLIEEESVEMVPGAFPVDDEEQERPSSLSGPLRDLHRVSSESLEHVSESFRKAHDLNAKLENINETSRQHALDSDEKLRVARLDVSTKQRDQQIAKQHLKECQAEMEEVGAKMEKTSDKRDGLRVGRVLMWGASLAYPPAAIVAAGMEVGAHKIRKKMRELQAWKETQEARNTALHQEVADLGINIKGLQSNVQHARKLSKRCQTLSQDLKSHLGVAEDMMRKFYNLKKACDSLSSSTEMWKIQAEMINEVSDDEEGVKRLMEKLLEDIDLSERSPKLAKSITSEGAIDSLGMSLEELLGLPAIAPLKIGNKARVVTRAVELGQD